MTLWKPTADLVVALIGKGVAVAGVLLRFLR
jgi:hypothetical protein